MKITEKKLRDAMTFASIPGGTDFYDVHGNKFRKINGSRAVRKRSDMVSNPKFRTFAPAEKVLPVTDSEATAHENNVTYKPSTPGPWVIVGTDPVSGRLVAHQKSSPNWGYVERTSAEDWELYESTPPGYNCTVEPGRVQKVINKTHAKRLKRQFSCRR